MSTAAYVVAGSMFGAIVSWLISILAKRRGKADVADTWRGIAGVLLLIAVASRVFHFFPDAPVASAIETAPYSVFSERLVSEKRGVLYDLVLDADQSTWRPYFDAAGEDVRKLGIWMTDVPSRAVEGDVAVSFRTNLTDKYGKISRVEVLILRWSKEDWRKAAWKTIQPGQVITLANMPFLHPAMRKDLIAWCATMPQSRWKYCN